jgi:hypothetical protein
MIEGTETQRCHRRGLSGQGKCGIVGRFIGIGQVHQPAKIGSFRQVSAPEPTSYGAVLRRQFQLTYRIPRWTPATLRLIQGANA